MVIKLWAERPVLETLGCPLDQIKKPATSDGKRLKEEEDLGIGADKYIS